MANDTTTATQPGILDTLSGWLKQVGGIVTAGTEVYAATQQRLDALEKIGEDTVKPATTAVLPTSPTTTKLPDWVIPAAVGVGVLILILVVRRAR